VKRRHRIAAPAVALTLALTAAAASYPDRKVPAPAGAAQEEPAAGFDTAARRAQDDLERSLKELTDLRERIAAEKLPLSRELHRLESRLAEVRAEQRDMGRGLDTSSLDLNTLQASIQARRDEQTYLANLLEEYVRNFETRVHITELQRYREVLQRARVAPEQSDLTAEQVYRAQVDLVTTSLDRLFELAGGVAFNGQAVGENGRVREVRFALIGPVGFYGALDGAEAGLAEQRLGSLEPNAVPFAEPERAAEISRLVAGAGGRMLLDPTLGNARKVAATQESLLEHVSKGGPVMVPILLLAAAALVVALTKWMQILRVRTPSASRLQPLLDDLRRGDYGSAAGRAGKLPGPTGEMLRAGLEHIHEPKELVEEVMFEKTLETRLRLQSFLPFVAVSAAAAPLLGLLGTVTGIINTFKLITVFGTGDAQTLSSGISEALITTEFGLIVAIPSLLLHAYLSRRARRLTDGMEKTAISFLNRISASSPPSPSGPPPAPPGTDALPQPA
jgi:biopolymer transport protein ExbB